ncbi:electron transfer flavoprotein subunit alpha/FixB family protein [Halanaerobium sp. Z-7514]|uniref:Electron transfer flavoprotein subunit alpha/FixB family protein n=1 Tax=Halanaerobium polyolivorans TaxID=2886943 RepID=A0AAW4WUQ8_9FIRM|nr:electron transfer flavoprotein subunit alpha/FixB family protein [Halanaerobium polyolivorans]MCC3144837.1 electron transfer flavoprotein subunit alpha/FixB family protein [Halanaerobium polyolivorans]RQD76539.1 MAG: electron transfer flavoprotein subunit alpha/FixB family protein [Halanaerobium sp. MSAO_Bac5]
MAAKKELLILAEYSQNKIHPVVFELLNKGQKLAEKADLNLSVLLLLPKKIDFSELIAHGADKVYYMEDPVFANPDEFIYKENILSFLAKAQIEIVLTGATNFGRSLAPRIAAGLKTGLTADCTALDIDEAGNLIQIRPAFSENILAHIKSDSRPQMATIRYQEFKKGTADRSRQGEIIALETKIKDNPNLKDIKKLSDREINIAEADIIVAGGSGVKNGEDFKLLKELADLLGGQLAASRDVVDAGLIAKEYQVGYSGQRVKPKLYFAFGISGAPQHLAGMKEAETIVAVNTDPSAPIFNLADYGIVADLYQVIPELIEMLKN